VTGLVVDRFSVVVETARSIANIAKQLGYLSKPRLSYDVVTADFDD
jgi:hypothetical protein